jgi:hypothetical protein
MMKWKRSGGGHGLIKAVSRQMPRQTEEKHERPAKTADAPAGIQN